MIRYKHQNTIWLAIMGVMMALVAIAGGVSADVQAVLLGIFMLAVAGSFIDLSARDQFFQSIQQRSRLSRMRASPQAREAAARASSRANYRPLDIHLADVGLIAAQTGRDGLVMRRTRSISKDDDGVRPFVTLNIPSSEADRNATVRFEIVDHAGRDQYIHEMRIYLRDGEMNILADHHLPLMKNDQIAGTGDWDLRTYIDGTLIGVHNFALAPTQDERRRRLEGGGDRYYVTEPEPEEDEELPMSLEELLRNQSGSSRS
jgi:hypothetical protein